MAAAGGAGLRRGSFGRLRGGGRAQMPDVGVVLGDGAVGGEVARSGDVHQHFPGPGGAVLVGGQGALLLGDVALHVQQGHEPVLVLHVVPQGPEHGGVAQGQHLRGEQEVHQVLDAGAVVVVEGMVAVLGVEADDLVAGSAEGEDVVLAHQTGDLDVGAVHGAQGDSAVGHELHVAGAAGFLGGQGDLLRDIAGGDQGFGPADVVVLHHHHVQPGAHVGVGLGQSLQAEDQVDDVLGHGVGRGGLGAEQHRDGPGRLVAALDLAVFVDDPQGVHLLALVLVQALDLDVKDGILVHFHPLALAQQGLELALVVLLDFQQAGQAVRVVGKGQQLFQLGGVAGPAVADPLGDPVGQGGVADFQPTAEGDAVGLVVELFGVEVVEGLQLAALEDLGVEGGHAVHRVAVVDVHVGHVHPAPVIQDSHPAVAAALAGALVQLPDDGHDLGGDGLDVIQGPLFQRLGQNGVVGVGAGLFHLLHGLVEGQAPLGQQADQFGDDHGGMGVVDLDGHMAAEGVGGVAPGGQLVQDQLGAGRHHEILLVDPQQLAVPVAVVGVEEGGQAVGDVPLVKVDAAGGGLGRVGHIKEVQPVGCPAVGPGDGDVVQHRIQRKTAEGDGVGLAGGQQPAFGLDPGIGCSCWRRPANF